MKRICIIGGGISGLSIALEKKKQGHLIQLLESENRLGGVIQSKKSKGSSYTLSRPPYNVQKGYQKLHKHSMAQPN